MRHSLLVTAIAAGSLIATAGAVQHVGRPAQQAGRRVILVDSALRPQRATSPSIPEPGPPPGAPGAQPLLPPYQTTAEYSPTDEEAQPDTLPTLPRGMTTGMLVQGDAIFHGKGGCAVCHGMEGTGEIKAGAAITVGLLFVDPSNWAQIDSLITAGIPDGITRPPISMPPRGGSSNLTRDEVARVAAYVWAIAQTRGEPWPGGHKWHSSFGPPAVPRTTGP